MLAIGFANCRSVHFQPGEKRIAQNVAFGRNSEQMSGKRSTVAVHPFVGELDQLHFHLVAALKLAIL
jgi:hypothetical protein